MNIRNTELKVLEILWEKGELPASVIYRLLESQEGWKKSTTYTVLQKCIEKGFVERREPNFLCIPLVKKGDVQEAKIQDMLGSFFNHSKKEFMRAFFKEENLSEQDKRELENLIERLK